jgi:copper chaperone
MTQEVLTVEGMSCNHCKNAVESAVKALPGITTAEVDLAAKSLRVEFDETKVSLSAIKKAVEEEGFTVK